MYWPGDFCFFVGGFQVCETESEDVPWCHHYYTSSNNWPLRCRPKLKYNKSNVASRRKSSHEYVCAVENPSSICRCLRHRRCASNGMFQTTTMMSFLNKCFTTTLYIFGILCLCFGSLYHHQQQQCKPETTLAMAFLRMAVQVPKAIAVSSGYALDVFLSK